MHNSNLIKLKDTDREEIARLTEEYEAKNGQMKTINREKKRSQLETSVTLAAALFVISLACVAIDFFFNVTGLWLAFAAIPIALFGVILSNTIILESLDEQQGQHHAS